MIMVFRSLKDLQNKELENLNIMSVLSPSEATALREESGTLLKQLETQRREVKSRDDKITLLQVPLTSKITYTLVTRCS